MNAEARLAAVRARLAGAEPGALWVSAIANVIYLTGFDNVFDESANAACLITGDVARVYTDSRYLEAAEHAADGTPWTVVKAKDSLEAAACTGLAGAGGGTVGFETSLPYARFRALAAACGAEPVPVEAWIEEARAVKEPAEVERIAR
ncbi:MAG TPA: aminopeptidase P family N-terminal domain-containing protein, partial [Coriobacteriia bacterium]|nr:aminopeptidase P family N-terminal domain-containing protein [Coriobacteriia bacterium]